MGDHQCAGFKADGSQCQRTVKQAYTFCYSHDPSYLEERRRYAARAGKGNAQKELRTLQGKLSTLLDDVIEGRADEKRASVAANVSNALSRVYSVALRVKEVEELEGRLDQLEEVLAEKKEARGY